MRFMTEWIKHPLKLEGEKVILLPLTEEYFDCKEQVGK